MGRPKGSGRIWEQTVGVVDGVGVIHLEHPDGRELIHYFDADLLPEVEPLSWTPYTGGYLAARRNGPKIALHMLVMGVEPGRGRAVSVDHKNRDVTDSRRSNLVLSTARAQQRNKANQSALGFGIHMLKGYYQVSLEIGGSAIFQPNFKTLEEAQHCRDAYEALAKSVDAGERALPTKEELRTIANMFRVKGAGLSVFQYKLDIR